MHGIQHLPRKQVKRTIKDHAFVLLTTSIISQVQDEDYSEINSKGFKKKIFRKRFVNAYDLLLQT